MSRVRVRVCARGKRLFMVVQVVNLSDFKKEFGAQPLDLGCAFAAKRLCIVVFFHKTSLEHPRRFSVC